MGQAPSSQQHSSRLDPLGIIPSDQENDFLNEVKTARWQGLTTFAGSRLDALLAQDPSLVLSEGNGWNALTVAVYQSDPRGRSRGHGATCTLELVQYLVTAGVDPNAQNNVGATPLTGAVEEGLPDAIADLLAREGADPDVTDNCGRNLAGRCGISKRRQRHLAALFNQFKENGPLTQRTYSPPSQQPSMVPGLAGPAGVEEEMARIHLAGMLGGPAAAQAEVDAIKAELLGQLMGVPGDTNIPQCLGQRTLINGGTTGQGVQPGRSLRNTAQRNPDFTYGP